MERNTPQNRVVLCVGVLGGSFTLLKHQSLD